MEDDKEIIYIALGIMIQEYSNILENEGLDQENRGLIEYILTRASEILDKLSNDISEEVIKRPQW